MLPLRYPHRWRLAGAIILVIALGVTVLPSFAPQVRVLDTLPLDKALHAAAFAMLVLWFSGQYSRRSYWRVATGLILFGAVIEVCQLLTSYRSAEWADLFADAVGIAIGLVVAVLGPGGWSLRLEHWIAARRDRLGNA